MIVVIVAALLLLVVFRAYRAVRSLGSDVSTHNPVLRRLVSPERVHEPDAPDTIAEAREGELTRQLLVGAIEAASYRQQLSELAQQSPAQTRDLG